MNPHMRIRVDPARSEPKARGGRTGRPIFALLGERRAEPSFPPKSMSIQDVGAAEASSRTACPVKRAAAGGLACAARRAETGTDWPRQAVHFGLPPLVPAFPTSLRQTLRRYLAGAGCLRLLRSLRVAAAACRPVPARLENASRERFSIGWNAEVRRRELNGHDAPGGDILFSQGRRYCTLLFFGYVAYAKEELHCLIRLLRRWISLTIGSKLHLKKHFPHAFVSGAGCREHVLALC